MNWLETFPHTIYASVLLNENNQIANWKIGNREWKYICDMTWRYPLPENIDQYKIKNKSWEVNNDEEHHLAFEDWSKEWFKQWEIEDNFSGFPPY